jgi:DNA-binding beta-propeller fold protein YncE
VNLGLLVCGAVAMLVLLTACGGGSEFPRAAEPAHAPPLGARPAGIVAKLRGMPEGMAFLPGAGLLAVALRGPSELAFVDPGSLRVRRRLPLPGAARHLGLAPSGSAVLVPAESANALLQVSPRAGILSTTPVGTHPHDAVAVGGLVFVADEHSDQVSVVRGDREVATLPAPVQPGGIAAAGNRYAALVAVAQRVLQVYDAKTLRPLGSVSAGTGPTHDAGLGRDVFLADTQGDRIREFRVGPQPRQVASVAAPGTPYGLAVDRRRRRLWVTLTARNRLLEYDVSGPRPRRVASYPTVRQPNSVEVDPGDGDVFVAGSAPGRIERISPREGGPG